jgi:hypothetical protein
MRFLLAFVAANLFADISVGFRPAESITLPGFVDSNSPAVWWQGNLVVFTSDNTPKRSEGPDLFHLTGPEVIRWEGDQKPRWIEAAWADDDGTIYAWYHHEPGGVCPGDKLTSPVIGAAISHDGGRTFRDLGIVLTAADPPNCQALNGFFAGGHGDFSVVLDPQRQYFYFVFTTYGGNQSSQGLGLARLPFESRSNPAGLISKYHDGDWLEPGLGGKLTPIFPPPIGWETDQPLAFWGPSVHWNYELNAYVMLMSRTCCEPRWPQEGVYLSFNADISNPAGWSEPLLLLDEADWYPQIIGLKPGDTADRAGLETRLFVRGKSNLELVFWPTPEESNSETPNNNVTAVRPHFVRPNRLAPPR